MLTMKQLLVPVDFSSASWLAIEAAGTVAQRTGAEIDLIHVWELPSLTGPQEVYIGAAFPPALLETLRDNAARGVEQTALEARARGFAIRRAKAMPGSPYQVIVEEAARGGYDLVVVGTHSRKSLARLVLGSVAERVVRYAPCSVLVARAKPVDPQTTQA
ncbi:MAG: universal stress protein [Polyangiales bacterium]